MNGKSKKLLSLFSLVLFFYFTYESLADLGNFRSSRKPIKVSQKRTLSSSSRSLSCQNSLKPNSIELLVPEEKVAHRTLLANPPLYFKVNTEEFVNIRFTLVNSQGSSPLLKKTISVNQSGVQKITLPPRIKLHEREIYFWNLTVLCSQNNETQGVLRAGIERVPISISLENKIKNVEGSEKIQTYVGNGIWYEGLDLAVKKAELGYSSDLALLMFSSNSNR